MNRFYGSVGFTLIELLVTIGIVAVLAAISLGWMSSSAKQAQEAKCLANLRQLSTATQSYCVDNAGLLPMTGSSPFSNPPWYQPLVQYISTKMKNGSQLAVDPSGLKYFQCPSYKAPPARDISYAPNIQSANLNVNLVSLPSKKIWLICSTDSYSVNGGGLQRVNFPHRGRACMVFFDGHTESLTNPQLQAIASSAFNPTAP